MQERLSQSPTSITKKEECDVKINNKLNEFRWSQSGKKDNQLHREYASNGETRAYFRVILYTQQLEGKRLEM